MKEAIIASFSALSVLIAFPTPATVVGTSSSQNTATNFSPVSLVSMAYQGQFSQQGIPGYSKFLYEYALGRIDAEKLVRTAIEAGRLPVEMINNRHYLHAVRVQLEAKVTVD